LAALVGLIVVVVLAFFLSAGTSSQSQQAATGPTQGVTTNQPGNPSYPEDTVRYTVTFQQAGFCSPEMWMLPWAVTLDSITHIQPTTAVVPPSYYYGTGNASLSEIVFSVPDGSYKWQSFPATESSLPTSGVVVVDGSGVTVQVDGYPTSCTTSVSTESSPQLAG